MEENMKIDNFEISCGMGRSNDWLKLGITKEQHEMLNDIGYRGVKDMGYTTEEYLNKIHNGKYQYKILWLGGDNSLFTDKYMVTRVELK
jgi:hypothetical protein